MQIFGSESNLNTRSFLPRLYRLPNPSAGTYVGYHSVLHCHLRLTGHLSSWWCSRGVLRLDGDTYSWTSKQITLLFFHHLWCSCFILKWNNEFGLLSFEVLSSDFLTQGWYKLFNNGTVNLILLAYVSEEIKTMTQVLFKIAVWLSLHLIQIAH